MNPYYAYRYLLVLAHRYGHAFLFDTGSSVGEIIGHSKTITSCDFKPTRPYRAVTCAEDFTAIFYHGPPFKYNKTLSDHTRFVNCVRYSPTGSVFASCGSDMKASVLPPA